MCILPACLAKQDEECPVSEFEVSKELEITKPTESLLSEYVENGETISITL